MQSEMTTSSGVGVRNRVVASGLIAGLVAIATGGLGASAPTPKTGTALTSLSLPRVTVTDPSGASHTVALGTISATAATAGGGLARRGLTVAHVLGTSLPDWTGDDRRSASTGEH